MISASEWKPQSCNRTAIETLIKAGAFDWTGARRSQLAAVLDKALQSGAKLQADRRAGQKSLFGDFGDDEPDAGATGAKDAALPDIPEWDEREKLGFEKEVLGYYLSSHPLAQYEEQLRMYCTHTTSTVKTVKDREEVYLGGMVASVKHAHVKKVREPGQPTRYVMFDLEDMDGSIRSIQWPTDFAVSGHLIAAESILVLRGVLDRRGGDEANLVVNEVFELGDLEKKFTAGIRLLIDEYGPVGLKDVHEVLRGYPGDRALHLVMRLADGSQVEVKSNRMRVELQDELLERLRQLLGRGAVQMIIDRPKPQAAPAGRGYQRRAKVASE
ncbi:MAG: hypothetical protein R3B96_07785 [Pirellulaceae bacterium]